MRFQINKETLLQAVSVANRLATTRATLPILQNLYLEASKDQLIIRVTDLEQTLEVKINSQIDEKGKITIPARLLSDYLQNNSDPEIQLETTDLNLQLKSTNHQAQIIGLPAEDYPQIPQFKPDKQIVLEGNLLKEAINKTVFACSISDTQPILNGELWRFQGGELIIVATDGYRLAKHQLQVKTSSIGDYLIPRKTILELDKIINQEEVEVSFSQSQVRFQIGETSLISRVIEGTFPAYEAIIPKSRPLEIKAEGTELLKSLRLASLFARDSAYSVKFKLDGSQLIVTAVSAQLGENSNKVKIDPPSTNDLIVSLNAQYLIEALNHFPRAVKLGLSDKNNPLVLTELDNDRYLYLLMPLRSE